MLNGTSTWVMNKSRWRVDIEHVFCFPSTGIILFGISDIHYYYMYWLRTLCNRKHVTSKFLVLSLHLSPPSALCCMLRVVKRKHYAIATFHSCLLVTGLLNYSMLLIWVQRELKNIVNLPCINGDTHRWVSSEHILATRTRTIQYTR